VRKISLPPGFDPRTVQPVASRHTDWAIPAPKLITRDFWNQHTVREYQVHIFKPADFHIPYVTTVEATASHRVPTCAPCMFSHNSVIVVSIRNYKILISILRHFSISIQGPARCTATWCCHKWRQSDREHTLKPFVYTWSRFDSNSTFLLNNLDVYRTITSPYTFLHWAVTLQTHELLKWQGNFDSSAVVKEASTTVFFSFLFDCDIDNSWAR